jgi:AcrR family transcriptional regulator
MTATTTAVRADARRNRERLISVAAEAFAAEGAVSLDAIAKRAGVGIGTLYRHFPTKEDLVEEVYRDEVRTLRDDATALLAVAPSTS